MRPLYEEFDDFDFGDDDVVAKMMREQEREEYRLASRRRNRSSKRHWQESLEADEDFSDVSSYEESSAYDDYDEDEFDSYADLETGYI